MSFELDPRLARDTVPIGDLMLSRVALMNDQRWPWVVLIPRRPNLVELVDLPPAERILLIDEIAAVSNALKELCEPRKINVAALGNIVSQLHVHVLARYEKDPAWPGPVFGHGVAEPYSAEGAQTFVARLAARLGFV
jgi:diadenosine tetraphosphate (Ap4A) HIT family hydrolase